MSFVFEGETYTPAEVLPTLRDAAAGRSRAADPDGRMNPESWGQAFAFAVAESPLVDALGDAVRALFASDDPAEQRLAQLIQTQHALVSAQELWNELFALAPATLTNGGERVDNARNLLSSLLATMAKGQADIDPRAWDLALRPDLDSNVRGALLRLLGSLEPARAASEVDLYLSAAAADTLRRIQYAVGGAGSVALERFVDTVAAALDRLGRPLPASSLTALAEMAAARKKAGK